LDSTDTYYFYHYDEAGNVILITDKNGNVVDHFEQDAWGNDLNSTFNTARSISQHQTSKFSDTTTGLYFFGARWYYPEIGRFISVIDFLSHNNKFPNPHYHLYEDNPSGGYKIRGDEHFPLEW
jgi:RHS repeat-associated protein